MTLNQTLHGRRILVVEDEYLIAQAMSRSLRRAGATVLGPVADVAAALALVEIDPEMDGAVLDINLDGQKVYPVVDALRTRGTPCVFATGNDASEVPADYAFIARCEKPTDDGCVVDALLGAAGAPVLSDMLVRRRALLAMREQLGQALAIADRAGEPLLAAKLCETLDVLNGIVGI